MVIDGLRLRGYVDRLDVNTGRRRPGRRLQDRVTPREAFEAKALFQMKFYALVLWRTRGVVPRQLRLMYLADTDTLSYAPDAEELSLRAHAQGDLGGDRAGDADGRLPAQPEPAVRMVRPPGALPGLRRHSAAVPGRRAGRGTAADRRATPRPDGAGRLGSCPNE